jgi:hypothetical protein
LGKHGGGVGLKAKRAQKYKYENINCILKFKRKLFYLIFMAFFRLFFFFTTLDGQPINKQRERNSAEENE